MDLSHKLWTSARLHMKQEVGLPSRQTCKWLDRVVKTKHENDDKKGTGKRKRSFVDLVELDSDELES